MKLELTEEQAQQVISSQERTINELRRRLRRAHVHSKYLARDDAYLTRASIQAAIDELQGMIDSDSPDDPEDFGFEPMYNHGALEEQIERYQALFSDPEWREHSGLKVKIFSYEYQYATNGFNDAEARNFLYHLKGLQDELWHDGEPDTPNFFSSDDGL